MYYLGIDISKKSFTVSVLDEEGKAITKSLTYPCTRKGMKKLVIAGLLHSKEALASLKHNPYLRSLYHREISEGKESKQALICVGKKILSIMYSMLKYEADYDPQRIFFQFEKERILT